MQHNCLIAVSVCAWACVRACVWIERNRVFARHFMQYLSWSMPHVMCLGANNRRMLMVRHTIHNTFMCSSPVCMCVRLHITYCARCTSIHINKVQTIAISEMPSKMDENGQRMPNDRTKGKARYVHTIQDTKTPNNRADDDDDDEQRRV